MKNLKMFIALTIIITLVFWSVSGYANPTGGNVVSGSATFNSSGPTLTINQSTNQLITNWQSFSIAAGETTRFIQPSSSSVALNRVVGSSPSDIFGTLSANGHVFLINQNGILFAPGSHVDVGGLIASTLGISNAQFLSGHGYNFVGPNNLSSVINQGTININAPGGYAALLGSNVENTGAIMTTSGTVALASGSAIAVNLDASGRISAVIVQKGVDSDPLLPTPFIKSPNPSGNSTGVLNTGNITANGGTVILTALGIKNLFATLINNDGIIEANHISVTSNGNIDLSNTLAAGSGGVNISGNTVNINNATISSTATNAPSSINIAYNNGININNSEISAQSTVSPRYGPPPGSVESNIAVPGRPIIPSTVSSDVTITGHGVAQIKDSWINATVNSTVSNPLFVTGGSKVDISSLLGSNGLSGVILDHSFVDSSVNGATADVNNSITAQTNDNPLTGNIQLINGSNIGAYQDGSGYENISISGNNITGDSTSSITDGDSLDLSAIGNIGTATQALNLNVGTLSGFSTDGGIYLNSLNKITLSDLYTGNGPINVTADGQITASNVVTGGGADDGINLTSSFGDIDIGNVSAAGGLGSVTLNSAGNINDNNANSMITANNLNLSAGINGSAVGLQLFLGGAISHISVVNGHQVLVINNQPGAASYNIYSCSGLSCFGPNGSWQEVASNVSASDGSTTSWTDPSAPGILGSYYAQVATAATSNIGSNIQRVNTNVNNIAANSQDIGNIYLNQAKAVTLSNLITANGLIDVIAAEDMNVNNVNAAGDVFLDSVNGSILGIGGGTNVTSAGDTHLTAGNLIGSWDPYSPLNLNVGKDLYLAIGQRNSSAAGSVGPMGVSGTLSGTVGGAYHFAPGVYNFSSSGFSGNPPGYIFLDQTEIWPNLGLLTPTVLNNDDSLAAGQISNSLQADQTPVYESLKYHLIRKESNVAPNTSYAYHVSINNNSSAIDHIRIEPEAYDDIDASIKLNTPTAPVLKEKL